MLSIAWTFYKRRFENAIKLAIIVERKKEVRGMSLLNRRSKAERFEAAVMQHERGIYLLCLRMMGAIGRLQRNLVCR